MESKKVGYKDLITRLRCTVNSYTCKFKKKYGGCVTCSEEAVTEAADAIETLLTERNILHAHFVTNWLGDCHCSNCKENIDYTSSYCNWCGAKLDEPEEHE